ncbi:MAG: hypothetical protein R3213_12015 [Flavobacteriaceae bacterium]|nr:hypothetical protein [Flavobacteriaceae bacterium]
MRIKSVYFRMLLCCLSVLIFWSSDAYSAKWQRFGELPESPTFGKTDYFLDIESISIDGNIRSVWLKSVFSKPQPYTKGKTYTDFWNYTYYNCSNKTYAVTRIDVYNSDGELVGSEKQDIKYAAIPEGSLDEKIYAFICNYQT